jgi:hypothetical protein
MPLQNGIHCKGKDKVSPVCTMDPTFAGMTPDFVNLGVALTKSGKSVTQRLGFLEVPYKKNKVACK